MAAKGCVLSAGDAIINGMSIKQSMNAIRQDLGVCPVKEHLMLYAAIKGFSSQQQMSEAVAAAHGVGESWLSLLPRHVQFLEGPLPPI